MGFLELRRQCGVSHEVRRGAQGASRVAPGKSGLHVRGEGSALLLSSYVGESDLKPTQGNRLSCRDQEGRRGSEEAVPGGATREAP